jgi:uncharacterized protein (DUF2141 family)
MNGETAIVTFRGVEPGRNALAVYGEENEDGKLDTNRVHV